MSATNTASSDEIRYTKAGGSSTVLQIGPSLIIPEIPTTIMDIAIMRDSK
jgi:hypothetical protein